MGLSKLIHANLNTLVDEWRHYALKHIPVAAEFSRSELENSSRSLFLAIAEDIVTLQSSEEQLQKSFGVKPDDQCPIVFSANEHADHRLSQGFTANDIAAEFRAARASVMRLWAVDEQKFQIDRQEIVRFNESIDEALSISLKRLETRLNRARDLFLGVLGHDMRNPLGSVILSAKILLKDESLTLGSAKAATRIYSSGSRLAQMLNDLLDFTRTRLGRGLPVQLVEGNMGEAIGNVVDELRAYHPNAQIQYETYGDVHGRWDFARLAQVVSNLGGNAIQHGDKSCPVSISLIGHADYVELIVANEGIPIPPESLHRIFDPLTRGTDSQERGSIGLGLYISRQIALAHQGSINVESGADGTRFRVCIPRRVERRQIS